MTAHLADLATLRDWIEAHGRVCSGVGTEAPHPAHELTIAGDDERRRVVCPSCAQALNRAIAGRPRR